MNKFRSIFSVCIVFLFFVNCSGESIDSSAYDRLKPETEENDETFEKDSGAVRVLAYNVHHFKGMDENINYERIANIITELDADFVCIQELDSATQRSGNVDQISVLGDLTDMHDYFGAAINYQGGKYGVGILSKEEAIETHKVSLPGKEPRTALFAEFSDFVIASIHLDLEKEHRLESIKIITEKANSFDKETFIAGDFNESDFSGDVFNELEKNWELVSVKDNTFPTGNPNKCIDFVFSLKRESEYEPIKSSVVYSLPQLDISVASDHYPVFCDFLN